MTFSLLQQNFGHFNTETKLVGQTYDGAAVMAGELNGLQKKIKSVAPQALFTHCYAHKLNLVLQDSCKQIRECRIFSQTFRDFLHFLQNLLNVPTSWIQFVKKDYQVTPRPDGSLNLALSIHYSIKEQI
jgi:hypothetical protein